MRFARTNTKHITYRPDLSFQAKLPKIAIEARFKRVSTLARSLSSPKIPFIFLRFSDVFLLAGTFASPHQLFCVAVAVTIYTAIPDDRDSA